MPTGSAETMCIIMQMLLGELDQMLLTKIVCVHSQYHS